MGTKLENLLNELEKEKDYKEEAVRTGIFPLDIVFPNGINDEVIQIAGDSGTAKTSISLQLAKSYCSQGKKVLYLNTQNSVSRERLNQFSLVEDININFFLYKVATFKKAEEILDRFISTDEMDLIIIDSIANLINDGYLNLEHSGKGKGITIDNNNSNYDSRPLSLLIRKYSALASNRHFSLVLVSALSQKVNKSIGTVEKRFGPKALDRCCTTIIKVNKSKSSKFALTFDKLNKGFPLEFEIIKSNIIRSNVKVPLYFEYGSGIKDIYYLVYYLISTELIKQVNSYYEIKGTQVKTKGLEAMVNEIYKVYDAFKAKYKNNVVQFFRSQIGI